MLESGDWWLLLVGLGLKEREEARRTTSGLGRRWMEISIPKIKNTGGAVLRDKMISSILIMWRLRCLT